MKLFGSKKQPYSDTPNYQLVSGHFQGEPFVGHYDINLLNYPNKTDYPLMLGISLHGFGVNKDGLVLSEDREAVNDYEDRLTDIVLAAVKGVYAGHSFWHSALEIIFYISEEGDVISVLQKEADINKTKFIYAAKIEKDPKWKQLKSLI